MQIPTAEAKAQFADLLRRAEAGEVIEITRYGKTVARLVAPETPVRRGGLRAAFGMMPRAVPYPGPPDWTEAEIDEMLASPLFPDETQPGEPGPAR